MTRRLACLAFVFVLAPLTARGQQSRPAAKAAPETIRIEYEYRLRTTALSGDEAKAAPDNSGLVTLVLTQDAAKAERFALSIEVTRSQGSELKESGVLIRGAEGWEAPDTTADKGRNLGEVAGLLNLGRRLRGLLPEGFEPGHARARWTVPFEKLKEATQLNVRSEVLGSDTPVELRFVGLRTIDGVACLAVAFSVSKRASDAADQVSRSERYTGLVLIEREGGMARLFNVTHKQRLSSTDEDSGERSGRVVATRYRLRMTRGAAARKKP